MAKKGIGLGQLPAVAVAFVVGGIILGMGAYTNSQVQSTAGWSATSTEYLAVANATKGIGNLSSWYPVIGVIVAAAVIIGILLAAFVVRGKGV